MSHNQLSYKNSIFTGTLILTLSGFLSRILGFYNRVFLSNLIGAKELGIYQLVFPIYLLFFTLCCHGFETGISNLTSRFFASRQIKNIHRLVCLICLISFFVSLFLLAVLYQSADSLSLYLLKEETVSPSLKIASLALPFVAVKSCLHGYYIGLNRSSVPAASQFIEQITRVGSIYFLSVSVFLFTADARIAVWGMVFGEISSAIYTIFAYCYTRFRQTDHLFPKQTHPPFEKKVTTKNLLCEFFDFSIPLTINHFSLTVISSLETILIPFMLTSCYHSQTKALEIYGTLTGMALPFLFFPATVTNSLSVMLLPAISSAHKQKKMVLIQSTIAKSLHYCIIIGIFSTFAFFIYGNALGQTIFHSKTAGQYVCTFAILCPFMYATQATGSVLNGFGKTRQTLYHNLLGVGMRITFILIAIPAFGIRGYLYGLLAGYGLQLMLDLLRILKITTFSFSLSKTVFFPAAFSLLGGFFSRKLYEHLTVHSSFPSLILLGVSGVCFFFFFAINQFFLEKLTT